MKNKKFLLALPLFAIIYYSSQSSEPLSEPGAFTHKRTPSSIAEKSSHLEKASSEKPLKANTVQFRERNLAGTLAVYKKMQRFPSTTQPFPKGSKVDPIAQRIAPKSSRRMGESSEFYEIEVSLEKNLIAPDDQSIKISLQTFARGKKIDVKQLKIQGKDYSQAIDRLTLGEYALDLPVSALNTGEHNFIITADFEKEQLQEEIHLEKNLSIAKHLQSFTPEINSQGDLVVKNEFNFSVSGDVLVEATLSSSTGELLGKAHQVISVTRGVMPLEITFYGLLIHDLKFTGTVEVKHLQLSLVDENLETKALEVHALQQRSAELHWDQFRSTPYDHPLIQEKIARLEAATP